MSLWKRRLLLNLAFQNKHTPFSSIRLFHPYPMISALSNHLFASENKVKSVCLPRLNLWEESTTWQLREKRPGHFIRRVALQQWASAPHARSWIKGWVLLKLIRKERCWNSIYVGIGGYAINSQFDCNKLKSWIYELKPPKQSGSNAIN